MKFNSQEEVDALFERCQHCYDGLLQSIKVLYRHVGALRLELVVGTKDSLALESHGWSSIRIVLEDVQEFRVQEPHSRALQVLSCGVCVRLLEGKAAIEFGSLSIENCVSLEYIRKSDGYAIGREIEIDVGLYESF